MEKKLERCYRGRRLTPEEVAADREIRRKVKEEFPPKNTKSRDATARTSKSK